MIIIGTTGVEYVSSEHLRSGVHKDTLGGIFDIDCFLRISYVAAINTTFAFRSLHGVLRNITSVMTGLL